MKIRNLKLNLIILGIVFILVTLPARAQFSFYLIDNFESGSTDRWYRFGNLQIETTKNPTEETPDAVTLSCGEFSLSFWGSAENWYVGGMGTDINLDASPYFRLQLDVYGQAAGGKLKVELFDDDNQNFSLEQDPLRDWLATEDDKWVAEVPILGKGYTRISIPFTAFKLENPGCGDGVWNPDQKNGSGGLLKIQLVVLTDKPTGEVKAKVDNLLLTY
ncbi:MAG: hypothetical protein ACPL4K_04830 [Candidatus Margulisiibacteriota bacterium]